MGHITFDDIARSHTNSIIKICIALIQILMISDAWLGNRTICRNDKTVLLEDASTMCDYIGNFNSVAHQYYAYHALYLGLFMILLKILDRLSSFCCSGVLSVTLPYDSDVEYITKTDQVDLEKLVKKMLNVGEMDETQTFIEDKSIKFIDKRDNGENFSKIIFFSCNIVMITFKTIILISIMIMATDSLKDVWDLFSLSVPQEDSQRMLPVKVECYLDLMQYSRDTDSWLETPVWFQCIRPFSIVVAIFLKLFMLILFMIAVYYYFWILKFLIYGISKKDPIVGFTS